MLNRPNGSYENVQARSGQRRVGGWASAVDAPPAQLLLPSSGMRVRIVSCLGRDWAR